MIVPIYTHPSEPYVAPKCPYCHHDLSGWNPPPYYPWWHSALFIVGILLAAALLAVSFMAAISIVFDWIDGTRTLLQVIKDWWMWVSSKRIM